MSLKYEPSSEPLHISAKQLFLNWAGAGGPRRSRSPEERIFIELMTSDRKLKASREGSTGSERQARIGGKRSLSNNPASRDLTINRWTFLEGFFERDTRSSQQVFVSTNA